MELARLASGKQQAASSKQATSPAGPFPGPKATGVPKSKKNVTTLSGTVSRNFLGNNFFSVGPPDGDLLGFRPVLGRGHLGEFGARAENRKTQFPGPGGTFRGEIRPLQKFLPEIAQFFYVLCFGRPDPHRREIAKYWGFRHFWTRTALGTQRNSGLNPSNFRC